jgi:negative regulator of flagellin synthesis FlgM
MEIENNHLSILARHTSGTTPRQESGPDSGSGAAASRSEPGSDSVSLTPAAQLLRDATNQVANEPVVDPQRVSAVREAMNNGSFEIDPARIADRILGMEQTLARLH